MWLNRFKAALAAKDVAAISALTTQMPAFETVEQMQQASYLLLEARTLMTSLQEQNKRTLAQMRKHIAFLKSTRSDSAQKLDIKS